MNGSKQKVQAYLSHIFCNLAMTGFGDASGLPAAATEGNIYLRLCTDAVAADIETLATECAYTGYVAGGIAVPRNATNWTVSWNDTDNQAEVINALEQLFAECTAGSETAKYIEFWTDNTSSDIADRFGWIELTATLAISAGVQPRFAAGKIKYKHK